jgi:hypothetical protein
MFLLWCGDVLPKVYIFVPRLVSGTGRGFGSAPQQKHTRCVQALLTKNEQQKLTIFGHGLNDINTRKIH